MSFVVCVFQGICLFHLSCWIYWHKVVQNISLLFCSIWRVCSHVDSLISIIGNLCLLFSPSQSPRRLLILLTSNKRFLFYWLYVFVFLISNVWKGYSKYFRFSGHMVSAKTTNSAVVVKKQPQTTCKWKGRAVRLWTTLFSIRGSQSTGPNLPTRVVSH